LLFFTVADFVSLRVGTLLFFMRCIPVVPIIITTVSDENGDLSIVFSVQGRGDGPTRPEPENRLESLVGPFLMG
jgi:hypothetical protein